MQWPGLLSYICTEKHTWLFTVSHHPHCSTVARCCGEITDHHREAIFTSWACVSCMPGWSLGCFIVSTSVGLFVYCASILTCVHALLPYDFTLVNLMAGLSTGVATMSSLAQ